MKNRKIGENREDRASDLEESSSPPTVSTAEINALGRSCATVSDGKVNPEQVCILLVLENANCFYDVKCPDCGMTKSQLHLAVRSWGKGRRWNQVWANNLDRLTQTTPPLVASTVDMDAKRTITIYSITPAGREILKNLVARAAKIDVEDRVGKASEWGVAVPTEAPTEATESDDEYPEGRERLRLHRRKERSPKAVRRKKETALAAYGKLLCEVCDFDFTVVYGVLGNGFAECHHRVPLAQLKVEHRIRLRELAIVCANCHRMLHRQPLYTVEELRKIVLSLCRP